MRGGADPVDVFVAVVLLLGALVLVKRKTHPMIEAAAIIGLFIFAAEFLD